MNLLRFEDANEGDHRSAESRSFLDLVSNSNFKLCLVRMDRTPQA